MSEVVTLSFSQRSNHLLTQLLNNQESHLPYSKDEPVLYDNNVFLSRFKTPNGKLNYTPRSIVYDLVRGYGSLAKYEYFEPPVKNIEQYQVVETGAKVAKNEYQRALDQGKDEPEHLNLSNTKLWSDYNKLLHNPKALKQLLGWELDENEGHGLNRQFPTFKFDTFNKGKDEFAAVEEENLDLFRVILEKCDLLQGINVLTEIDSAWAGFGNQFLVSVKDEFFNNGINKYNFWIYGLLSHKLHTGLNQLYSRITSIVELAANSTLFFPLEIDPNSSMLQRQTYDSNSNWHNSSIQAFFVNSIWGLNNRLESPVTMSTIEDELLRGYTKRNIVNEIRIHKTGGVEIGEIDRANLDRLISNVNLTNQHINLGISTDTGGKSLVKSFIIPDNEDLVNQINTKQQHQHPINIYKNNRIEDILHNETTPSVLPDSLYTEMGQSTSLKKELRQYRDIVGRSKHNDVIEEKEELVEALSDLVEEYTVGYEDSDEDFD